MKCLVRLRGHVSNIIASNVVTVLSNVGWRFITSGSRQAYCVIFTVGADHGLVHRLSVSHPGFILGLLCGKGVK